MKITYICIVVVLIVGAATLLMKGGTQTETTLQNSDSSQTVQSNTASNGTVNANTNTSNNNQSNMTNTTSPTNNNAKVAWEGTYQIVEFGNLISDSEPMSYDMYGYTDITVTSRGDQYDVKISQRTSSAPFVTYATGRVNEKGLFEIVSDMSGVLFTMEHGNFGANTNTRITLVAASPLLKTTTNKFFDTLKKDL